MRTFRQAFLILLAGATLVGVHVASKQYDTWRAYQNCVDLRSADLCEWGNPND